MAYLTTEEFTSYIGSEIAGDEPFLARCLAAAEDAVNDYCARSFDVPADDADPSTRVYVPARHTVIIHDIVDDTDLTITNDGSAVSLADVQLEPLNNVSWSGLVTPYNTVRLLTTCWVQTYMGEASVSVTSTRWGWPAVPPQVKEATAVLAKDVANMRETRFGVIGFGEFASARLRANPQVQELLSRLRHPMAFGVG